MNQRPSGYGGPNETERCVRTREGSAPRSTTFANIAVANSVDIKIVSVLLGHADPAMTLRVYADSLVNSKHSGMERLDGIL